MCLETLNARVLVVCAAPVGERVVLHVLQMFGDLFAVLVTNTPGMGMVDGMMVTVAVMLMVAMVVATVPCAPTREIHRHLHS